MTHEFHDILGRKLEVGDTIAVAFPKGSASALQRIGTIVEFSDKDAGTMYDIQTKSRVSRGRTQLLVIQWDAEHSAGSVPKKPTGLEARNVEGRCLKINKEHINGEP